MEFGQRPDPSRRLTSIGFVVLLHLVLIYALWVGLEHKSIEVPPQPIETKIVKEEHHVPPPPPPPPPPQMVVPPADFVPPPEINIAQPPPRQHAIAAVTQKPQPPKPPAPARHVVKRVAPVIDASHNCPTPQYPAVSLRYEEEGTVILRFLIGLDGRVKDSQIQKTSGSKRLDEAARQALSRCQFIPGKVDGVPKESWALLRYQWQIPN